MIGKGLGLIWKGIKGFALFWVDFVIGDSPEIAIGVAIIFGIALALRTEPGMVNILGLSFSLGGANPVTPAFVIPAAAILLLVFGVWHGRNR